MEPYDLLKKIIDVLEQLQVPYFVTGSVAAMAYGEPRLTNDIDIVTAIENKHVPELLSNFSKEEFYISEEAVKEAIKFKGQFNIIHPSSGLKADLIIRKNTPFDNSRFKRMHRIYPAESFQANFASPEDVIIKKLEYYKEGGSEKHLRDITGILKVSGKEIDRDYVSSWAKNLHLTEIWDAVKKRIEE